MTAPRKLNSVSEHGYESHRARNRRVYKKLLAWRGVVSDEIIKKAFQIYKNHCLRAWFEVAKPVPEAKNIAEFLYSKGAHGSAHPSGFLTREGVEGWAGYKRAY